jgi:Flp pilus assembly pilin Flp
MKQIVSISMLRRFWREDDAGNTATEYAVMLGLIILAAVGAITALGTKMVAVFEYDYSAIDAVTQ